MLGTDAQITERENIHDLRNLFGIVSSASHLLERDPPPDRRAMLLDALSQAARRGGALTTALLAKEAGPMVRTFDLSRHFRDLQSLLDAQSGSGVDVFLDVSSGESQVRLDASVLDAAILELVANAHTALGASGRIIIRAKRVGRRIWVLVADTGPGMNSQELSDILYGARPAGAHGTGLGRVRKFAQASHAHFHMRSKIGRGTVVALTIPIILQVQCNWTEQLSGPPMANGLVRARRARRSREQQERKKLGIIPMASQPGESKPDIIEPLAPPETPPPAPPGEAPMPIIPEIVPVQPNLVPEAPFPELPPGSPDLTQREERRDAGARGQNGCE